MKNGTYNALGINKLCTNCGERHSFAKFSIIFERQHAGRRIACVVKICRILCGLKSATSVKAKSGLDALRALLGTLRVDGNEERYALPAGIAAGVGFGTLQVVLHSAA